MRERRWYMAALAALVVGGFAFAAFFRANIPVFDFSNGSILSYEFDMSTIRLYEATSQSAQELLDASEAVVSVRATGVRTFTNDDILSEVTVEQVYKGDSVKRGDTLLIFEPITVSGTNEVGYDFNFYGLSNLMAAGNSYILPLRFFERPEEYRYSEEDKRMYLLTDPYYGPFPVSLQEKPLILEDDRRNTLRYADTLVHDCVAVSQEEFEAYRRMRGEFLELIGFEQG